MDMGRPAHRPPIEAVPTIDLSRLKREGKLAPGQATVMWRWHAMPVTWVPWHWGGQIAWLHCPGCAARSRILYATPTAIRCRRCFRLAYASERENKRERMRRRYAKAVQRIAGGPIDLDWPEIPPRPPGMWRRTYARWVAEAHRALEEFDAA